jgi:hypothetical protein
VFQPASKQLAGAGPRHQLNISHKLGSAAAPLKRDFSIVKLFKLWAMAYADDGRYLEFVREKLH